MNKLNYRMALSRRDELLRQAADYKLTYRPTTVTPSKPTRRTPLELRRGFLPKSA